jgi:cytochrome c biogenesis protein CcdA
MASSSNISSSHRQFNVLRGILFPALVAVLALGIAFVGAIRIGSGGGIDGVNGFVELLSGSSSSYLGGLVPATFLFAFAAGMASAVNPCGFAMLPAYLGLYLGDNEKEARTPHPLELLGRAVVVGGVVTVGFIVLFGLAGVVIGVGFSAAAKALPWLGLAIGIGLTVAGAWILGGGKLYTGIAARAASHMGDPGKVSLRGYFMFGLSYGTASLSCTLPIFLAVVGIGVAGASFFAVVSNFVLFATGMGFVIMILTLGMAFARGAMVGGLRKALPYIQPMGSLFMVIAGAYIVFYWLTIGGLL